MFIGHFGVALAAKKAAPRVSLGMLIFSAQFLDFLWPLFLWLGVEHVAIAPGVTKMSPLDFTDYPYSHSLLMAAVWSAVIGAGYYAIRRNARGAWIVGLAALSHWGLDWIVHRPDLPIRPGGGLRVGLALWDSWPAGVASEVLIFTAGLWLYLATTGAQDKVGQYGFWSLMGLLCVGWMSTLFAGAPPSVAAIAFGGMVMWLIVPWGWWADRHRVVVPTAPRKPSHQAVVPSNRI